MRKNFFFNFLLTVSNLLFPLLTFPYLSRVLGAEGLGLYNFIISYGQNFIIIAALGIPLYGMREIAKAGDDLERRSNLFWELLLIHFIFTVFLLIIYTGSIYLYADLKAIADLAFLGGWLIFFSVFTIEWLFTGINNFKYITIRSLIIRTASIIAVFVFVTERDDYYVYLLITVISIFLTVGMNFMYSRKFISSRIRITRKGLMSHLRPVGMLGGYTVLTSTYSVLPVTLLGFLSTKSAVGYFYGANKILRMVISAFSALITVMVPRLNQAVENRQTSEYTSLINKSLNIVISFGIPITLLVYLLADPLVMVLAGSDFQESVQVIQIMAPVILLVAFAQVFIMLILSVNRKDKQMLALSLIGMCVSLLVNILFIPEFAEVATAYSQLLSELLVTLTSFFLARKVLKFRYQSRKVILNIICVLPFFAIHYISVHLFNNHLAIMVFSGGCCLIYFILYQWYIIKDQLLIEIGEPYMHLIKRKFGR